MLQLDFNFDTINSVYDFTQACKNVKNELYKNKLYKNTDFNEACKIAWQLITNDFKYKNKIVNIFRHGNLKLDDKTLIFDIPEIITCKHACVGCYALKSSRIYKNTRIMRLYHMLLLEYAFANDVFYNKLINKLYNEILQASSKNIDIQAIRLHGAGDIYKNKYLKFILNLCNKCIELKNVRFYTYTKQLKNELIDDINKNYINFNIIKSNIDNKFINFGNDDYLKKVTSYLKDNNKDFYICDYGQANVHTCMGTCKKCLYCSHVLFHKH